MGAAPILVRHVPAATWTVSISGQTTDSMVGILLARDVSASGTNAWGFHGGGTVRSSHILNFRDGFINGPSESCLFERETLMTTNNGTVQNYMHRNSICLRNGGYSECYGITNCVSVECNVGFTTSNDYELPNCLAIGCTLGFSITAYRKAQDCIALNCTTGYAFGSSQCYYHGDERLAHHGCVTPFTGTIRGISPMIALANAPLIDPANGDFRPKPGADGNALKYLQSFPQHVLATPAVYEKWVGAVGRSEVVAGVASGDRRNGGVIY